MYLVYFIKDNLKQLSNNLNQCVFYNFGSRTVSTKHPEVLSCSCSRDVAKISMGLH